MKKSHLLPAIASVALVVGSVLILLSYSDVAGRARTAARSGGRVANTTAGPIEFAEKGAGLPLLAIHGAGGGYDQGLSNAAEFVGDGFRVIAPSRFGYLGTPVPADASSTAQADAHAALLAELKVDKVVVVGISAGARSAIELALRHQDMVTALILMVPATYAPTSSVAIEDSRGSRFAFWLVNAGADFAWWATGKIAPAALIRFLGVSGVARNCFDRRHHSPLPVCMRSRGPNYTYGLLNVDAPHSTAFPVAVNQLNTTWLNRFNACLLDYAPSRSMVEDMMTVPRLPYCPSSSATLMPRGSR